jgi:signal peptidase II
LNDPPTRLPLIAVGLIAAFLDLLTKWWVFREIPYLEERTVVEGLLYLHPVRNDAGPWSVGRGLAFLRFVLPLVSVVAVVVIGRYFWQTDPRDRVRGLGFVLILGGAFGNLWDRGLTLLDASYGGVRDFLLVRGVWFHTDGAGLRFWDWRWGTDFPAFNLADAWITAGVVLVGWRILFEKRPAPGGDGAEAPASPSPPAEEVRA